MSRALGRGEEPDARSPGTWAPRPPPVGNGVVRLELRTPESRLLPRLPAAHRDLLALRPQDLGHDGLAGGAKGEAAAHRTAAG